MADLVDFSAAGLDAALKRHRLELRGMDDKYLLIDQAIGAPVFQTQPGLEAMQMAALQGFIDRLDAEK